MTDDRRSGNLRRRRLAGGLLIPLAAAALGVSLVLARQAEYGVRLDHDSLHYLAAARNLVAGEGLTHFDGSVYTGWWPPLYPLLLAAASFGVFDPLRVAGPLGACAFGLAIFLIGRYLAARLDSRFLAAWVPFTAALSLPLAEAASWAITEAPFLVFSTLALIGCDARAARGSPESRAGRPVSFLRASASCALALLTRFVGAVLGAVVGLALLLERGRPLRRRLGRAAVHAVIAFGPLGFWILRHWSVGGEMRRGAGASSPVAGIVAWIGRGLRSWLDFDLPVVGAALPYLAVAAGVALVAAAVAGRRRPAPAAGTPGWRSVAVFGGFSLAYTAALVLAVAPGEAAEGVAPRYLIPLYLPLLVALATTLDRLLLAGRRPAARGGSPGGSAGQREALGEGVRPTPRIAAEGGARRFAPPVRWFRPAAALSFVVLGLWTAGQARPNARAIAEANRGDRYLGFVGPARSRSETLAYLRENAVAGPVHTNEPAIVDFRGTETVGRRYPWPCANEGRFRSEGERLRAWLDGMREGQLVVVFHHTWRPPCEFAAGLLRVLPGLETVAELADGAVYRRVSRAAPRPDALRAAERAAASGELGRPAAEGKFAAYLDRNTGIYPGRSALVFHRRPCSEEEVRAKFRLHLFPFSEESLPPDRRRHGFDNRDFVFGAYGRLLRDESGERACAAVVPLPRYEVSRFATGQIAAEATGGETIRTFEFGRGAGEPWTASGRLDTDRLRAAYRAISSGAFGEPAARASFDLYLDGPTLLFFREPCSPRDAEKRFFVHLYPEDPDALPRAREEYGFENRDFRFDEAGRIEEGRCVARLSLPDYPITRLRTGQWAPGEGDSWSVEIAFPPEEEGG